jgi:hypothetical protein
MHRAKVDVVGRAARRIFSCALVVAVSSSACLLYTDRINEPPALGDIQMMPEQVFAHAKVRFTVGSNDGDGDAVSLTWSWHGGTCAQASGEFGGPVAAAALELTPSTRQSFCVRVTARDARGAEARPQERDVQMADRAPEVVLTADPAGAVPLYGVVRVDATRSSDLDDDGLSFAWEARDATGAPVELRACDARDGAAVRCLTAERSGTHMVTVHVSDGMVATHQTLALTVAEDRPPCIETTDPALGTEVLVLTAGEQRRFEVRKVNDDGHPYPGGARGETTFVWSLADGEQGPWGRQSAPNGAVFIVGPELLQDPRPGSTLRVRVEARDPMRERPEVATALEAVCLGRALCESPPGCFRWVSWKVRFQ